MDEQKQIELDLIDAAKNGQPDAFGELYKLHLDAIYRYIYSRVGEVSETENLTQTTFVKAWKAFDRYQPRQVPFLAWLYRIAHNTVVDYHRTKKEATPIEDDMILPDKRQGPEEQVVSKERRERLHSAITKLKPAYQQVLSLRFLNGLNYKETAEVLGRKVNAVRVMQFRAIEALQKVIGQPI